MPKETLNERRARHRRNEERRRKRIHSSLDGLRQILHLDPQAEQAAVMEAALRTLRAILPPQGVEGALASVAAGHIAALSAANSQSRPVPTTHAVPQPANTMANTLQTLPLSSSNGSSTSSAIPVHRNRTPPKTGPGAEWPAPDEIDPAFVAGTLLSVNAIANRPNSTASQPTTGALHAHQHGVNGPRTPGARSDDTSDLSFEHAHHHQQHQQPPSQQAHPALSQAARQEQTSSIHTHPHVTVLPGLTLDSPRLPTNVGIFISDGFKHVLDCNTRILKLLNCSRLADILNKSFLDFNVMVDHEIHAAIFPLMQRGQRNCASAVVRIRDLGQNQTIWVRNVIIRLGSMGSQAQPGVPMFLGIMQPHEEPLDGKPHLLENIEISSELECFNQAVDQHNLDL
ncbi:uncharacterized protein MONBRDRAFT_29742 [Monosiga brevicollis MX1]|uniref:BHLH domain-containing protein n=1 Tax=Monosiga brevicollis TaxID=81824 RepID=A9VBZ9_MONBE|nr:uncharacterized protein MONBRDRAFT_29742 [Monosiga brevicollis MX1]EDQ84939.1 predicted protein [Monosiga brevicollis MX1]|eukprot:XP_001750280.1 hypothetical protein [Monosiga brevicollis MX1]